MFSRTVSRVALSGPSKPSCTVAVAAAAAAAAAARTRHLSSTTSCSSHQRRHSSSKASYPPGHPRNAEPAADNTTGAAAEDEKRSSNGRLPRRRSRDASATDKTALKARDEAFANIPAVPSTSHLQLGDVHTSSFFSLHRPISVTTPIPPVDNPRTISMFNSIFTPPPSANTHKPADVIYTVSHPPAALDSPQSREEKDLRWEILQQSSSNAESANRSRRGHRESNVIHLDGPPQHQSLEELVKQFRPFNVPPPPVPFDDVPEHGASQSEGRRHNPREYEPEHTGAQQSTSERYPSQPSLKTFTTTLIMTEATSSSGAKTYSASASPIVEREIHQGPRPRRIQKPMAYQPFLARLYQRQTALEDFLDERADSESRDVWAISVRRQRARKMKKHKLKKLRKRLRNQKRKEGKL